AFFLAAGAARFFAGVAGVLSSAVFFRGATCDSSLVGGVSVRETQGLRGRKAMLCCVRDSLQSLPWFNSATHPLIHRFARCQARGCPRPDRYSSVNRGRAMAFNPFHAFRRHQKVIFALLTIVAMVTFIFCSGVPGTKDFFLESIPEWVGLR